VKKHVKLAIKIAVLVIVVWMVGGKLVEAWRAVAAKQVVVDWRWGALSVAGFCLSMLTSALVWRWLAWRMGRRDGLQGDGLPTVPLLGAYTFSQMGKYGWKVALLLMRIERTGRLGMSARVCTLSTLLENALYLISGGLVGMTAVLRILGELGAQGEAGFKNGEQSFRVVLLAVAVGILLLASHPRVFYGLVNRLLKGMKKPEVPAEERLGMGEIVVAVVSFLPCWLFGGVALWACANTVHPLGIMDSLWLAGAYALSVIFGMVFMTPGGLGVRELVTGAAIALQLSPLVGHAEAVKFATIAATLMRLFQMIAEALMGMGGLAAMSVARRSSATPPPGMAEGKA
jgi:uncharacterized membrane protein YbhN (UPF0104 family)